MIPIMGCSLIAVTVVFERLFFFRTIQDVSHINDMINLIRQEKLSDALAINEQVSHPTLRVLAAGILGQPDHTAKAMETAGIEEITTMRRGLPILDTIITLAPLLGLLGTIIGMIDSFAIMSESGIGQPHAVTGGIAEALICTAAGIGVAVVTLVPYNYFLARIEWATTAMEQWATKAEMAFEKAATRKDT